MTRRGRWPIAAAAVVAIACAQGDRARIAIAAPPSAPTPRPGTAVPDFARDVQPILTRRCQPCHFPGGVMYGKLPFDREATVHELGAKLFTRIKDPKEQAAIRSLLDRGPGG